MCNFTPSAQMSLKTVLAVGELVQAAAHINGITGPVEFTVLTDRGHSWCGLDDDYVSEGDDNTFPSEWLKDTEDL